MELLYDSFLDSLIVGRKVLATAETTSPAKPRDLQEAVKRVAAECTKAAEEIQELQKE